jgi:hypothetical protein
LSCARIARAARQAQRKGVSARQGSHPRDGFRAAPPSRGALVAWCGAHNSLDVLLFGDAVDLRERDDA